MWPTKEVSEAVRMFIAYIYIYKEMKQNNETVLYLRNTFTSPVFGLKNEGKNL